MRRPAPEALLLESFARTRFGQGRRVVRVRPRVGRCASALLFLDDGSCVFAKQDPREDGDFIASEARILQHLSAIPGVECFIPPFREFDSAQAVLITEGLRGYVPLNRRFQKNLLIDEGIGLAIAFVLAAIHSQPLCAGSAAARPLPFPVDSLEEPTPDELSNRAADYAVFVAALQGAREQICGLRAKWRPGHLIHCDLKADNLLIRVREDLKDRSMLILADWELAGAGDPLWDVGSYLGSVFLSWIQSVGLELDVNGRATGAQPEALQRQSGHFLIAYRHFLPSGKPVDNFIAEAMQYAGIFLLHRVQTSLEIRGFVGSSEKFMLDLGCSLLKHPERGAETLIGAPLA